MGLTVALMALVTVGAALAQAPRAREKAAAKGVRAKANTPAVRKKAATAADPLADPAVNAPAKDAPRGTYHYKFKLISFDGTPLAAQKLDRVLTNDPGMGVLRHADAGYDEASQVARDRGVRVPMDEHPGQAS